ncbi:P-type conjugative transfer protein TrbL [Acidithiobacillus caldus]
MKKKVLLFFLIFLATVPSYALAGTTGLSGVLTDFTNSVNSWYNTFFGVAEGIFATLLGVDIVYLVAQWLIGGKDVHEIFTSFMKKILSVAFFATLLVYNQQLIHGVEMAFQQTGVEAAGQTSIGGLIDTAANDGLQVFQSSMGTEFLKSVGATTNKSSKGFWSWIEKIGANAIGSLIAPFLSLVLGILVALILLFSIGYLVMELLAAQMEAALVGVVGLIMLGFSGSRFTTTYAEGYIKYGVSVGVRLMVLELWAGFINKDVGPLLLTTIQSNAGGTGLESFFLVILIAFFIGFMTKKLPSLANSILTGASSLSGGEMLGAAAAAGAVAAAAVATGGAAALGAAGGGGGVLTGAQAASAAGNAGGAAGKLGAAAGGAGGGAGLGGLESAGEAASATPVAENAVPAPEPSPQQQDTGLAPTAEQIQAALQKYPPIPARTTGGSAGQGAKVTQGAGGPAVTQGSGGSADLGSDAQVTQGTGGSDSLGAGTGASRVTESGQTAGSSSQSPEITQGAGGSNSLGFGTGASRVTGSGGAPAAQDTPPASEAPSEAQSGQQAPTAQEALRAALQQSIQQAFAPMQESLGKLNETLVAGQKPASLTDKLMSNIEKAQKTHKVSETMLSPGDAEKTTVQANSLGLKHSE